MECDLNLFEFLPVVAVRGQHDARTGVGVARDPGAVDSKHEQHHDHTDDHHATDVGPQTVHFLLLLVSHLAQFSSLGTTSNVMNKTRWVLRKQMTFANLIPTTSVSAANPALLVEMNTDNSTKTTSVNNKPFKLDVRLIRCQWFEQKELASD